MLQQPVEEPQQAFKGASKGSHGCEECGSRWHLKKDCPTFKRKNKQVRFTALSSPFEDTDPVLEPGRSSSGLEPEWNSSPQKSTSADVSLLMHRSEKKPRQRDPYPSAMQLLETTTDVAPAIGSGSQHFRLDLGESPPRSGQPADDILKLHRSQSSTPTSSGWSMVDDREAFFHGVLPAVGYPDTDATFRNYHLVRGTKRCGFLIDEGASSGLAGTDTIRE